MYGGELPQKEEAWEVCRFKGDGGRGGELAKKRGRVFEMRLYPNAYYECFKNFPTACFH